MKIDYSSFENTIRQLEKSISFLNSEMAKNKNDKVQDAVFRRLEIIGEAASNT